MRRINLGSCIVTFHFMLNLKKLPHICKLVWIFRKYVSTGFIVRYQFNFHRQIEGKTMLEQWSKLVKMSLVKCLKYIIHLHRITWSTSYCMAIYVRMHNNLQRQRWFWKVNKNIIQSWSSKTNFFKDLFSNFGNILVSAF